MKRGCANAKKLPAADSSTGYIEARCDCGEGVKVPDKGLGRAVLYAWMTQHQGSRDKGDA